MSNISRAFLLLCILVNVLVFLIKQFSYRIVPHKKMAVTISQGTLIGLQRTTRYSNKSYFSFLGVPYAKPPIKDLRFMPPVKHPGWTGELKAFSEGNRCMQYPLLPYYIPPVFVFGSEDCLYLNIFVPEEETNENKAVMVFIHGGAFSLNSASMMECSPDNLLENNVIVVTFNYRLNVLGFLNFDIDECSGNMGLKDQRLALKWVKENISAFGGDPENITIFGLSSGSVCVNCHMLSPQSSGLFQKAIMQSGCIFNSWAMNEKHKEAAFKLAKLLGCSENDDPKDIVKYLKSVPAIDLVKYSYLNQDEIDFLNIPFVPSIECDSISNPFLSAHPKTLLETASPVPVISGLCNMEGLFAVIEKRMTKIGGFRTAKDISSFLKDQYSDENVTKIQNFYFNDRNVECEVSRQENIVQLHSDFYFVKDFYHGFEHLLKQNVTPVYNYEFKFDGKSNIFKNLLLHMEQSILHPSKGAMHGDDMNYVFSSAILFPPQANSTELKMCKLISKLWSNFAKTGNPNSPELSFCWKNTSSNDPKYLAIDGDNTQMVDGLLYGSRVKLWEDIETI